MPYIQCIFVPFQHKATSATTNEVEADVALLI